MAEVEYSGKELLALPEEITGDRFTVAALNADDLYQAGLKALEQGDIATATSGHVGKLNWDGRGAAYFEEGLQFGKGRVSRKSLR